MTQSFMFYERHAIIISYGIKLKKICIGRFRGVLLYTYISTAIANQGWVVVVCAIEANSATHARELKLQHHSQYEKLIRQMICMTSNQTLL